MGFMSGSPPHAVKKRDLVMDVTEEKAHEMAAEAMVDFFSQIILGKKPQLNFKDTKNILSPIKEAMTLEGFYGMKPPCYGHDQVNPIDDPTCWHGAAWHDQVTQIEMGGDTGKKVTLRNDDNFHRVDTVDPVHLPHITNTCDGSSKCVIETRTVS